MPIIAQVNAQVMARELHRLDRDDRMVRVDILVSAIYNPLFVEQPVITEMVAKFAIEFARGVVMEPSKSEAVIQ